MSRFAMILILTIGSIACAARTNQTAEAGKGETQDAGAPNDTGSTSFVGLVKELGTGPFKGLVIEFDSGTGRALAVTGNLQTEIAQLIGLKINAAGRVIPNPGAPPPTNALDVTSYQILSVNGDKPYVGTLTMRGNDMWIEGTPNGMKLTGYPASLHQKHGAKVWIVGRVEDGALVVQSFGIIREKP